MRMAAFKTQHTHRALLGFACAHMRGRGMLSALLWSSVMRRSGLKFTITDT